jgi:outer membrane protein TolC
MKKNFALMMMVPFALFGENLSELVELSKNNKMIDASQKTLDATKAEYNSVKGGYLPSLSVGANYQLTNKETNGVPDNSTSTYGKISFTIYDGGARGNIFDNYEHSINSASEYLVDSKNQLALQVVNYYYTYLSLVSQKEAKIKEIEQLKAQQERLEKFLDVGTTTQDEVQLIVSKVESANVILHEIELNIQTILHNLEYTVGKSVDITKGSTIKEFTSKEESLRSDIQALEYNMKALLSTAKSKKSGYFPTLTISDTYTNYDLNYETATYSSNRVDYSQNLVALNLTWNIFSFGQTSNAYKASYKRYLALKSQYEYEKNKASVDLRLALKSYEIGKLKITSANAGLKAAQSAYKAIKAKYQNGIVDNVAYLEALSNMSDAQSALQTAKYDLEIKKANIIYYNGKTLEEFIK